MHPILKLTSEERLTLEQLSINHRHRDIRLRALGLLMIDSGMTAPKAAERLNISGQSLYNWIRTWHKFGVCGLLGGHRGGRPRKVPESMIELALNQRSSGIFTLKQIAKRVEELGGKMLPCSLSTFRAALRREGWQFKRRRNEAAESNGSAVSKSS
ncbi:helix-turn-helix domain-containing protein [Burkholderia ubonensis]|uniref:helix-turn-helix domain-containing protein n=1 Tax=Burkholderia ubonensis TaxID=101571 RepID=UPI0009B4C825|nr:helix-turn-helix domain-containing protein [Burkholderia ubonensis]